MEQEQVKKLVDDAISRHEKTHHITADTGKFVKPTIKELSDYAKDKGFWLSEKEAQKFYCFYETRNWVPGGSKKQMKSWKAALSHWILNGWIKVWPLKEDKAQYVSSDDKYQQYLASLTPQERKELERTKKTCSENIRKLLNKE
jgi:hypothetical protein